jgi:hypothetical protein
MRAVLLWQMGRLNAVFDAEASSVRLAARSATSVRRDAHSPESWRRYSHSMVPGGLLVMSSTTRLTSATSLVMRVEMRSSTS